jgi:hypothetical protein
MEVPCLIKTFPIRVGKTPGHSLFLAPKNFEGLKSMGGRSFFRLRFHNLHLLERGSHLHGPSRAR